MKIVIEPTSIADITGYRVTITEHLSILDDLHYVDKVTTSPILDDELLAKCWLAKWLSQ